MAKKSGRAASNKRFEALLRAQKMNELMKIGGMQSQALLDSAGESRPSNESHVTELLDSEKFTRSETSGIKKRMQRSKSKPASRPKPAKRAAASKKKRR